MRRGLTDEYIKLVQVDPFSGWDLGFPLEQGKRLVRGGELLSQRADG